MKKDSINLSPTSLLNLNRETLIRLAQIASGAEDLTHVGHCSLKVACTN